MKKLVIAGIAGILIFAASPAMAGDIFDNSKQVGHFIAGMLFQEVREDIRNEQRRQEEEQRRREQQPQIVEVSHERDRDCRGGCDHRYDRDEPYHRDERRESGGTKMQKLFWVHDRIVNEVLEESYESTQFILDIHEGNGHCLEKTARDIRPFVYDYFDVFDSDRQEMYSLWVETKLENWLDGFREK